jgi:phage FluMu gp28-like protein
VADNSDNALGLLKRVKDFLRSYCELTGLNIDDLLKYNSKYELYIEAINSTYHIGTAQNSQFGRSKTITNLHLSEMAFYPAIDEILAGAMQAVTPQGRVIIETTANGHNKFKDFWDSIQRGESNFKSHFYKASDFYSDKFLQAKKKELGRLYKQEYPETDTEAFISSGDTYFDSQALEWHLRNVKPTIGGGYV